MATHYYICPGCGEDVEVGSDGCPNCNAGEDLNFHEDGLDLDFPEDDLFDYDKFVAEEFGGTPRKTGKERFWFWVIVLFIPIFLWWIFIRFF